MSQSTETNPEAPSGKKPARRQISILAVIFLYAAVMVLVGTEPATAAVPRQTVSCAGSAAIPDPEPADLVADCNTLLGLKGELAGSSTQLNWSEDTLITEWTGVTVSSDRVTGLALTSLSLTGSIPAELGSLTGLTSLQLNDNALTGSIPKELGSLTNLTSLQLSNNALTGDIPKELGGLTNLEVLYLNGNELTGDIPAELGSLTKLTILWLNENKLTGDIPAELGSLTSLKSLFLSHNALTGSIPAELGSLAKLESLVLSSNELTGSIPAALGSLTNLTILLLSHNALTGSIPTQLGGLTSLTSLWLGNNALTGDIPAALGSLTNLTGLQLNSNALTGSIPAQLGGLTGLTSLHLYSNVLTGSIPAALGSLTKLESLFLSSNKLTGSIPAALGSLTNLTILRLDGNRLTGRIPTELDNLVPPTGKLTRVLIPTGNPDLCGPIPPGLHGFVPASPSDTDLDSSSYPDGTIPCRVTVSYEQSSYTVSEGSSVVITVTLSADPERTVTIPVTKTDQGGASGADYAGVPDSLTFNSGDTAKSFTFSAAQDTEDDDGESVKLAFGTLPTAVSAGTNSEATVHITEDDLAAVTVSYGAATYTSVEGGSAVTVTVHLDADPERTVTIPISVTHNGGASGADYSGVPGSVTFNSGDTEEFFTVTATDDSEDDDGESLTLRFDTLPAGVSAGSPALAVVSLQDNDDPAVTVSYEQSSYTVGEGSDVAVKVTLSADPERTVTIPVAKTDQGGASDADYSGVPDSLTFNSGDTEKSFTVTATDDNEDDDGESVKLAFGALPTGVSAGTNGEATVNITDDDLAAVTVSYGAAAYTSVEGGSAATVTVHLDADPERTVTIPISVTHNGGASSADYSGVPGSVTFNSGDTEQSFTVTATDDSEDDDGESLTLRFGTLPAGVSAGTPALAVVSLQDNDDPAVTVSYEQSSYTVSEGGSIVITVTLSADPERTVTIPVAKTDQGGASDSDYSGVPDSVTFNSGETEASFTFSAAQDTEDDDGESVKLAFGALPTGVSAGTNSEATVNITDDDLAAVTVSYGAAAYTSVEGGSAATVTVHLDADPERTVTIPISVTHNGGASSADYSGVPGSVTFNSGDTEQSFTVTATDDSEDDDGESLTLRFGTLPTGVSAGSPALAMVSLQDNDDPAVTVSYEQSSYTVSEGGSVVITVTLSADPERTVTIPVAKTDQGGASGADYSGVPDSLTFNSGETEASFTFSATQDTEDDDGESVKLAFGALPTGVSAGANSEATVNITDDDLPAVTVSYAQSSYTVGEGGSVVITVTLSADPERTVTIPVAKTDQGGASDADYSGVPDSLTFNSGETEASFTFSATQDTEDDDGESVKLAFGTLPTGVSAGTNGEATVNITDDDLPAVTVSYEQSSYTVSESSSVTVKVTLSADPERTVTIPVTKTDQGGASGADYSGVPDSVTFNSGDTEKSFTFSAVQDTEDDDGESVKLAFGALPTGVSAGTNSEATVNITDDDLPAVTVSYAQPSYTVGEGGSVVITVTLSADPERTVTIPVAKTDQGGASDSDYSGVPDSLTFNSGETEASFTFSATQDTEDDDGESVKLAFGTLPTGVSAGTNSEATVNITDDDLPAVTVSYEQSSYTVSESSSVTVKVTLSADPERTVTIPVTKTDQGGATGADYSGVPDSVTFNSGDTAKSFTFSAVQDTEDDDGESVKLAFGALPTGVSAGANSEATVNITDDDLPAVTVSYAQSSYTVGEGSSVVITVTLSADPERTVTIPVAKTDQGGASGSDYSGVPDSVTFSSGDTAKSFTFSAAQDTEDDDGESVKLAFGTLPTGVSAGTNGEATVNITDDDLPVEPTPTPTATITPTPTPTWTNTPSPTPTYTPTASGTTKDILDPVPTWTNTPTPTATITPAPTPIWTNTPSPTPTHTPVAINAVTPAPPPATATPTSTPTSAERGPTPHPSVVPTSTHMPPMAVPSTSTPKPRPPSCIVPHPATPVQVCRNKKTGALHFYFVGHKEVFSGPMFPPITEMALDYPTGYLLPEVELYRGTSTGSGKEVVVHYLTYSNQLRVSTYYADNEYDTNKPYIFTIDSDGRVTHLAW